CLATPLSQPSPLKGRGLKNPRLTAPPGLAAGAPDPEEHTGRGEHRGSVAPGGDRHGNARVPFDPPWRVARGSVERRARLDQSCEIGRLAEAPPARPPAQDAPLRGGREARGKPLPVAREGDALRLPGEWQQALEMGGVDREDRILPPRLLDPELGLIGR